MKVLHLFSNYKWTGPAEPALNLALNLRKLGIHVGFACGRAPARVVNKIFENAAAAGLQPIQDLHLAKHRHPIKNWSDRRTLRRILQHGGYDLLHCHLDNDHQIAIGPAARLNIPIVRSSYHGEGFPNHARLLRLLQHKVFLIEPSRAALENDARRFRFPLAAMTVIPGAVDTNRFDPARQWPDVRPDLAIPPGAIVIGIVARMQRHRHYEDLWNATRKLVDAFPNLHVLVVGRGTHQDVVGKGPVQELNLSRHVHFSGYVTGDTYTAMLNTFDIKVFLVPGSDGTCRAVREAMAMGKPAVVARRGMLPEIVDHNVNGLVFENTPQALYEALARLAADSARRQAFGKAARQKALAEFNLQVQAERVANIYRKVIETP